MGRADSITRTCFSVVCTLACVIQITVQFYGLLHRTVKVGQNKAGSSSAKHDHLVNMFIFFHRIIYTPKCLYDNNLLRSYYRRGLCSSAHLCFGTIFQLGFVPLMVKLVFIFPKHHNIVRLFEYGCQGQVYLYRTFKKNIIRPKCFARYKQLSN